MKKPERRARESTTLSIFDTLGPNLQRRTSFTSLGETVVGELSGDCAILKRFDAIRDMIRYDAIRNRFRLIQRSVFAVMMDLMIVMRIPTMFKLHAPG